MKITCKQQDLARGLSTVSHAVSTRSTLPILANILVATDGERVRLSATNLEVGITCWVPATIHAEGTTTVPARLFTDFVNTLPADQVDLTLQAQPGGSQVLRVSGQRTAANIHGMDPAEFPTIPSADGSEAPVTLDAAELRAMIAQVAFAAATDDARPVFTGVLARMGEGKLTFAAADSFRLAVRETALPTSGDTAGASGDVLIPARTLIELARVLPAEGEVRMIVTPNRNQVLFHAQDVDLVSNLIAGQFPNYQNILPKTHATTATVETTRLRDAAKRAALFARDSANIVRVKVEAGDPDGSTKGSLTVSATAEQVGDATDTVDAEVDGPGLEIIFNVKYLTDVLGVVDADAVVLELSGPQSPGLMKPAGEHYQDYSYVVMPMHNTR